MDQAIEITMPLAGVNTAIAPRELPAQHTYSALNVWPVRATDGSARIERRPGLAVAKATAASTNVQGLFPYYASTRPQGTEYGVHFPAVVAPLNDPPWDPRNGTTWANATVNITGYAFSGAGAGTAGQLRITECAIDPSQNFTLWIRIQGVGASKSWYLYVVDPTSGNPGFAAWIETGAGGTADPTLHVSTFTTWGTLTTYSQATTGTLNDGHDLALIWTASSKTVTALWSQGTTGNTFAKVIAWPYANALAPGFALYNTATTDWFVVTSYVPVPARPSNLGYVSGGYFKQLDTLGSDTYTYNIGLFTSGTVDGFEYQGRVYLASADTVVSHGTATATSATAVSSVCLLPYDIDLDPGSWAVDIDDGGGPHTHSVIALSGDGYTVTIDPVFAGVTGKVAFRFRRQGRYYDRDARTISSWASTAGTMPYHYTMACVFSERVFLSGDRENPHVFYASRQGDPLDWDYGSDTVSGSAFAGTLSSEASLGCQITALVPHANDYILISGANEIWVMRGDPSGGGVLTNLSRAVGILSSRAWCYGPSGETYFLSSRGLCALDPSASAVPSFLSENIVPALSRYSPDIYYISLAYDPQRNFVLIFLTPKSGTATCVGWAYDLSRGGFWPIAFVGTGVRPVTACTYAWSNDAEPEVIIGASNGKLYRFVAGTSKDDASNVYSFLQIGPIRIADDGRDAQLVSATAIVSPSSGNLPWHYSVMDVPDTAWSLYKSGGTWVAGTNYWGLVACRGRYAWLTVGYPAELIAHGNVWAIDSVTVKVRPGGTHRKL